MLHKVILFSFCFCLTHYTSARNSLLTQNIDNLNFEKVQTDGLTNHTITCIRQDKYGFLWFATDEGLFRYDGNVFKMIKTFPGDSTSLPDHYIQFLYPENNKLWVGSFGGLSCIDIDSQKIKNFPADEFLRVNAIVPGNDSLLWIGTSSGLFRFNRKNAKWKRVDAIRKNDYINSICDDKKGNLYLMVRNGGFYCYNPSTGASKYYHPDLPTFPKISKDISLVFTGCLSDSAGNIWMGTAGAGIARFNPKNETIQSWCRPLGDKSLSPFANVSDLLLDNNSNIWMANASGGLTIYNPAKNKIVNYPVEWESENKISRSVRVLFCDRSGIFWIGADDGIFKYDPHSVYLTRKKNLFDTEKNFKNFPSLQSYLCLKIAMEYGGLELMKG